MRVITGTARGRKLKEPEGQDIRPTSGAVKEAIFNIIQFDTPGRRVLDLFAGTGQLGIEALSRGARSCDFVDRSGAACKMIRENLAHCKLEGGRVYQMEAARFLRRGDLYDLVFVDPPYDPVQMEKIIQNILQFDILNKNGIMVCETREDTDMPEPEAPYAKLREYRYGKVKLTLYTRLLESGEDRGGEGA